MMFSCTPLLGSVRYAFARPDNRAQPCGRAARSLRCQAIYQDEELEDLQTGQRKGVDKHVISWYPGHIAKAERQLKEQLSKVDIVFEVRDARILQSTAHPQVSEWIQQKPRFVLINRTDMVGKDDLARWREFYASNGDRVFFTNGQLGTGIHKVMKAADDMSEKINASRTRRGLRPRSARVCVVGFPNIGKSAIINRLTKRRVVESAAKPGVTTKLQWVRMGAHLDLLDCPGIIPASFNDQKAAQRLAICNDIGMASYVNSAVAVSFLNDLTELPNSEGIIASVEGRYGLKYDPDATEDFVWGLADKMFQGDAERAGQRILKDYRDLRLGAFALEVPP